MVVVTLNADEKGLLERCEAVIVTGRKAFVDVGGALTTIRDEKLYRDQFQTFENYCKVRWEFDRSHAYRFINSADVMRSLSPIGDILPLPKNEAQTRPLVSVPAEKRLEAWKNAIELAGDGDVTARHVASAAKRICPPAPRPAALKHEASNAGSRSRKVVALKGTSDVLDLVDSITSLVTAGNSADALELLGRLRLMLGASETDTLQTS